MTLRCILLSVDSLLGHSEICQMPLSQTPETITAILLGLLHSLVNLMYIIQQ